MPEIQVTDEKGLTHIFPDGSTPEMIAKAMNVQPPAASLDLSNKQGQGTYQMADKSGQRVAVPYGQVPKAAQLGYGFADDANRFRFAKDSAADPNHSGGAPMSFTPAAGDPRADVAYQQQMERDAPTAMQVVGGMAKAGGTLMRPVLDVAALHTHTSPAEIDEMLRSQTPTQAVAKYGTIGAAVVPAAVAAPLATAGGVVGGTLGAGAGQVAGQLSGMSPERTQVLSDILGIGAGAAGAMGASRATGAVVGYLRPKSSPSIVPRTEMAARNLSAAILPATKDASNFIQAAQEEVPNILAYAKRTGNPLNTQLEFSKAASGYAQEVRGLYNDQILGPVENKLVPTTGTGFGRRMGEGPETSATLGEIDKRIVDLNKQLDSPALNSDDARKALASKTDLQAEAAKLKQILHDSLSDSSGLAPDQIADIRQRVGRSYELANDTNAAVTQRMQAQGRTDIGAIHWGQLPSRTVEFVRGGPVSVADRAFQRAIKNFPGESSALPSINPPIQGMTPPTRQGMAQALGGGPTSPPSNVTIIPPDTQLAAMNQSLANRGTAVRAARIADMQTAEGRAARMRELLQAARDKQRSLQKR